MQIRVPRGQQKIIKMRFERGILYTSSVILGDTSTFEGFLLTQKFYPA
jgi:hypothetical protein